MARKEHELRVSLQGKEFVDENGDGIPGVCSSPVQFIPGNFVAHENLRDDEFGGRGFRRKVVLDFEEGKIRGRGTLRVGLRDF